MAVHFTPNPDTSERLVVAVVGHINDQWSIAEANALKRLTCLYASESVTALIAIETGLKDLRYRLMAEGPDALSRPMVASGLSLSEPRMAEATDAEALARNFLAATSSLHDPRRPTVPLAAEQVIADAETIVDHEIRKDRLPILVMREVEQIRPALSQAFNRQIQLRAENRDVRIKPQEVYIAFSGSKLVANFATLRVGRRKRTVDLSKRLMWDLEQHRRQNENLLDERVHEMLLYHPPRDDPEVTERQYGNLREVAEELDQQGHQSGIRVSAYESVPHIAKHVVSQEAGGNTVMEPQIA